MPLRKSRVAIYTSVGVLLVVLLLPGFCQCPPCVIVGSKPEPCTCTILGVYLARKSLRFFTGTSNAYRDVSQGVAESKCNKH
jgi:predicted nucleic acid-binding Zn finger protein